MAVGYAKLLLDSKNIKILLLTPEDSNLKISSLEDLKAVKNNDTKVSVEYMNLENYYTIWDSVNFKATSYTEGVFTIF